jgi:hypothetical protein
VPLPWLQWNRPTHFQKWDGSTRTDVARVSLTMDISCDLSNALHAAKNVLPRTGISFFPMYMESIPAREVVVSLLELPSN